LQSAKVAKVASILIRNRQVFAVSLQKSNSLLSAEEVADLTGLSMETLAQWRSQKRGIPYLKIGRCVRYDANDVQSYLAGCRVSVSNANERRQNR
jgi:excisionase family DNA binding protein